jgi:hypothetical protein
MDYIVPIDILENDNLNFLNKPRNIIFNDELIELDDIDVIELILDEPRMVNNVFIKIKLQNILNKFRTVNK